jgi:hypothetical protein
VLNVLALWYGVKLDRLVDTKVPKEHTVTVFRVHVILILWVMTLSVLVCCADVSRAILPSSSG